MPTRVVELTPQSPQNAPYLEYRSIKFVTLRPKAEYRKTWVTFSYIPWYMPQLDMSRRIASSRSCSYAR